ncbi:MAG: glycosyltransferase [Clostridia bacterium]|nr:glycosyltransferase [Clostridia bacterium]MDD4386530.1 glycosyltransferase [Clostridia bacterium]
MKKILFLIHTLRGGGAEKALVQLVNSMDKIKFDITVMTVVNTGKYIKELNPNITYKYIFDEIVDTNTIERKNFKYILKYIKLQFYYNIFWKINSTKLLYRKYIKDKYDVEVSFLEGISAKIISSSNNKESTKICWIHTDLTKNKSTKKFFKNREKEKKCYSKFDKIVCVSANVRKCFMQELEMEENNQVIVRHNPMDINTILIKSNESYKQICRDIEVDDTKIVCSIGRLETLKGYDKLLRVHKKLIDNGINHKLIILGEGSQYDKLNKYISDNNLQKTAKLLGFKNNPYPYIKLCDIYACTSVFEGMSIAVCEAMVLGKPVFVTEGTGLEDIIGPNNKHGIIVKNSEEGIYRGLCDILQNHSMIKNYAKESRKVAHVFELKRNVKNIENLFK